MGRVFLKNGEAVPVNWLIDGLFVPFRSGLAAIKSIKGKKDLVKIAEEVINHPKF